MPVYNRICVYIISSTGKLTLYFTVYFRIVYYGGRVYDSRTCVSTVGSLMYAIVCTRPDLSQAISMVSRYMHNPSKGNWEAVKQILQYIKCTIDVGLVFKKDFAGKQECIRYVDSDYAGDLDKRWSTRGYVFTLS